MSYPRLLLYYVLMVEEREVTIERAIQLTGFSRHHLERLIKARVIDAHEKDGVQLLKVSSLEAHSEKRAQKRAQKKEERAAEQEESIVTDGAKYVSLNRAARLSGYTQEYIQNLTTDGVVHTKFLGERLYIDIESLFAHRRAIHAQQAKWYEEQAQAQARTRVKKEEPVVVHRVSIYSKDETPLFPVLSSKHHQAAPVVEERMQTGSRLKTVVAERPRKSTPSPFAVSAPKRPAAITVAEPIKTRAVATETNTEIVRPKPQRKQTRSFIRSLAKGITVLASIMSIYIAATLLFAQPQTARAAYVVGDILGLTEATIAYYSK